MFVLRILIGLVFLISGAEKVLSPYQNFLYTLQAYQLPITSLGETLVAQIFPWFELLVGVFLVLGLWTAFALRASSVLFAGFIIIVGQALLRQIPLENCGCFGELVHISPRLIIVMDSLMLLGVVWMLSRLTLTQRFSCDAKFKI